MKGFDRYERQVLSAYESGKLKPAVTDCYGECSAQICNWPACGEKVEFNFAFKTNGAQAHRRLTLHFT